MITLKSQNTVTILTKKGSITTYIYVSGDFVSQTKTKLKFRELYYYYDESTIVTGSSDPVFNTGPTLVRLPGSSEETIYNLKMKDAVGETFTAEETEYNKTTVDYLFNVLGADITKKIDGVGTGYSNGVDLNFNQIFYAVQVNKEYFGITNWIIQ